MVLLVGIKTLCKFIIGILTSIEETESDLESKVKLNWSSTWVQHLVYSILFHPNPTHLVEVCCREQTQYWQLFKFNSEVTSTFDRNQIENKNTWTGKDQTKVFIANPPIKEKKGFNKEREKKKSRRMNTRAFLAEFPFLGQEVDAVDLLLLALCAIVLLIILAVLCRFYLIVFACFCLFVFG